MCSNTCRLALHMEEQTQPQNVEKPVLQEPESEAAPARRRGRPKGSKNKRTDALDAARAVTGDRIRAALGPDAFTGDAWEFLVSLYADTRLDKELRLRAAATAIKYERPALQATELTGANGSP